MFSRKPTAFFKNLFTRRWVELTVATLKTGKNLKENFMAYTHETNRADEAHETTHETDALAIAFVA